MATSPAYTADEAYRQHENLSAGTIQSSLARWTDEQEIALLKAIVRWKPDLRIIAIHDYMIAQGVVYPGDEHTTIPGLWIKLRSLYNLPMLDEREDPILQQKSSSSFSSEKASPDKDTVHRSYGASKPPESQRATTKSSRRTDIPRSKSPAPLPSRAASTIADTTDEPASSPPLGRRGTRLSRRSGRLSKPQQNFDNDANSRRTSKTTPAADDEAIDGASLDIERRGEQDDDAQEEHLGGGEEAEAADESRARTRSRRSVVTGKGSKGKSGDPKPKARRR